MPDDDRERDFVLQILQNIPFLGQAASLAVYEGSPVPALSAVENVSVGANRLLTGRRAITQVRGVVKILEGLAGMAGLPGTSQAAQIVRMALRDQVLIFPFRGELRDLEESAKKGPLLDDERNRLTELRKLKGVFDAGNGAYKSALQRGDMETAQERAEDIFAKMKKR